MSVEDESITAAVKVASEVTQAGAGREHQLLLRRDQTDGKILYDVSADSAPGGGGDFA